MNEERATDLGPENYAAAREVLERTFKGSLEEIDSDEALEYVAREHARLGDDKFRLAWRLREPKDAIEAANRDLYSGQLSLEEHRERVQEYVTRPVDLPMLEECRRYFEDQVEHYSAFMRSLIDAYAGRDRNDLAETAADIDVLVERMQDKRIWKDYLVSCCELVAELRAEKGQSPLTAGKFQAAQAAHLVWRVCGHAAETWMLSKERTQGPAAAIDYFHRHFFNSMPEAFLLGTLLDSDFALARHELKKGSGGPAASTIEVESATAESVAAPSRTEPPGTALSAENSTSCFPTPAGARWTDLRIRFLDPHRVSVQMRDVRQVVTYEEMGMKDGRNGKPNKQWDLLQRFGDSEGYIDWNSPGASRHLKKQVQLLSDVLTSYFGVVDRPIDYDPETKGYRTSFIVEPDEGDPMG